MHTVLAHHNTSDSHFGAHIISIRGNALCIGCTASKAFMHLILPTLLIGLGYFTQIGIQEKVIFGLFIFSALISGREVYTGTQTSSLIINSIPGLFQAVSLLYVATLHTHISLSTRFLLASGFALPQLLIYIKKIVTRAEYQHVSMKFMTRLLLIMGLFFAILDLFSTPVLSGMFVLLSGIIFVKLRKFSSYRVGNDKIAIVSPLGDIVSGSLQRKEIIDTHGLVATPNTLIIFIFFVVGLVSLVSTTDPLVCDYSNDISAALAVPFLALSSVKYCPNCGDPVDFDEKFCDKCGLDLKKQAQTTPTRESTSYRQPQRYDSGHSGGGYYQQRRRGGFSDASEARATAIAAAVIIFFMGWFFTGSFVVGIIVGAIAFAGVTLAASTDNCCIQYLILDCCSDCICSIISNSSRRR